MYQHSATYTAGSLSRKSLIKTKNSTNTRDINADNSFTGYYLTSSLAHLGEELENVRVLVMKFNTKQENRSLTKRAVLNPFAFVRS